MAHREGGWKTRRHTRHARAMTLGSRPKGSCSAEARMRRVGGRGTKMVTWESAKRELGSAEPQGNPSLVQITRMLQSNLQYLALGWQSR